MSCEPSFPAAIADPYDLPPKRKAWTTACGSCVHSGLPSDDARPGPPDDCLPLPLGHGADDLEAVAA